MCRLILVLLAGAMMSLVGCQYWRGGSSSLASDSTNSIPPDRGGRATGGTGPGGSTVGGTGSAPER